MQLHDMLRERKKRANESALEYFLEMKKIARQGSIDDFDLVQYVIEGIPDDPHRLILRGFFHLLKPSNVYLKKVLYPMLRQPPTRLLFNN
ncbi:UNVERIFIED_CONTAM: hypothetical protein PYX00_008501 [Menopon gallinae]|uniref:Uncharacterized protein n=1 Tax=Menopon gallinae TaxID=328185 RepID=A0AAW2HN38_9NEOP